METICEDCKGTGITDNYIKSCSESIDDCCGGCTEKGTCTTCEGTGIIETEN